MLAVAMGLRSGAEEGGQASQRKRRQPHTGHREDMTGGSGERAADPGGVTATAGDLDQGTEAL